jgi:hypothetical protein
MKKITLLSLCWSAALLADGAPSEPNSPAGPVVTDWADFFFTAEFIWWKAQQDGLAYAQSGRATSLTSVPHAGSEADAHFDFEPGFKVGGGLNWRYDGWDLYANYTWLSPAAHTASIHQKSSTGGLQAVWPTEVTTGATPTFFSLSRASDQWKVAFSAVDTEMGRNFFVSTKMTLRPFIGFKAAWIHQHNTVNYHVADTNFVAISQASMKMHQEYTGFGIRGGLNTAWRCSDDWSIFGNAAFSELWSRFDNHRIDQLTSSGVKFTNYALRKKFHGLTPVLELALGLRYTKDFRNHKWRLDLSAAWELQTFFSQNRFLSPIERQGDFTLQGATARIGFAF